MSQFDVHRNPGRKRLVLNPFEMVSVEAAKLGPSVASLADDGALIIAALDEVLSRAHG